MRFLHTGDWHLGRLFHGQSLVEDQAHVLDQLVDLVAESRLDALIIAGDLYDRAVPPPEAVELFDDFLGRVTLDLGVPVVAIAGNHDSAARLRFGARLLERGRLHVRGGLQGFDVPVVIEGRSGPVEVFAVPYAEPAEVRAALADDGLRDADAALGALLGRVRLARRAERRCVVVAHAFVAGGSESESERPLSVGGSAQVSPRHFEGFDYAALGHLHRPQCVGADHVRYAGSLLAYSFSEVAHGKSLGLVELGEDGAAGIETVELSPRRRVRILEGPLGSLLETTPGAGESRDDYLLIRLDDEGAALLHPMARLRSVYPNVLQLERLGRGSQPTRAATHAERRRGPEDLFADFYAEVTGRPLGSEQARALADVMRGLDARVLARDAGKEAST